jgi:hypothetical protein
MNLIETAYVSVCVVALFVCAVVAMLAADGPYNLLGRQPAYVVPVPAAPASGTGTASPLVLRPRSPWDDDGWPPTGPQLAALAALMESAAEPSAYATDPRPDATTIDGFEIVRPYVLRPYLYREGDR